MTLIYHGPTGDAAWYGDKCKVVEEIPAMSWRGTPTNGEPGSVRYLYDAILVENLNGAGIDPEYFTAPKSWFHAEVRVAARRTFATWITNSRSIST